MALQWYVVHAYSGFENQVKRALEERVARAGMEDLFGEILVPTEEVVEMRDGTFLAVDIYRPTQNGTAVKEPLPVIWMFRAAVVSACVKTIFRSIEKA